MYRETFEKELLLIGGGHSHIEVLKRFRMKPFKSTRVTLISNHVDAQYSGMLPGLIAGHYTIDESNIDLFRLAQVSGSRFIEDEVIEVEPDRKYVCCRKRGKISYDVLSINIGSMSPKVNGSSSDEAISLKPISDFRGNIERLLRKLVSENAAKKIGVIGAGAAGIEVIMAIKHRLDVLKETFDLPPHTFHLFTSNDSILLEHPPNTRKICEIELEKDGIEIITNFEVDTIEGETLNTKNRQSHRLDYILWATGAAAPKWLLSSKLNTTNDGFISVNPTLESENHRHVFASGDIANVTRFPRPKSGVFAVRQGPPLARNLRRALENKPLKDFKPQRMALAIISLGRKCAVASHPLFSLKGTWVWSYKKWLDERFIKKYQELRPMVRKAPKAKSEIEDTRCGGCGSKVAPLILKESLDNLPEQHADKVIIGLRDSDDAAIVRPTLNSLGVHTIDYFKEFIDDPWILGKIAVNHSINDIFAMGAIPKTALAIVGLPLAHPHIMRNDMSQLMSGSLEGLKENNTTLIGGHTNESSELNIGFSVNGEVRENQIISKKGARAGDSIILTRPLGTGVLFAGAMSGKTKGRWISAALNEMCRSNFRSSKILGEYDVTSLTDVTGFGLVGHLSEMLRNSCLGAKIYLEKIPVYEGAIYLSSQGVESTLMPDNYMIKHISLPEVENDPRYQLCFDPQTSGGLLATLGQHRAAECIRSLRHAGYFESQIIGEVSGKREGILICNQH